MAFDRPVLELVDLRTSFRTEHGEVKAVDGVSLTLHQGETLGLVGESGSGKSVTSLSIMGLIPPAAGRIVGGKVLLDGVDLVRCSEHQMRAIRGNEISMIFQEPMTSLNPVYTIGDQILETVMLHQRKTRQQAAAVAVDMLSLVGIPEPRKRFAEYPHQLSGGMRQRVMIAMALSCNPKVLIADEPTTALDVTIQAQILALMQRLQQDLGMAILFITHDLGVVAELADRVAVMYTGRIVEEAPVDALYGRPKMPYTMGLLNSIPRLGSSTGSRDRLPAISGAVAGVLTAPEGCTFHPRCPFAAVECRQTVPPLEQISDDHFVRCVRHAEISGNWREAVASEIEANKRPVGAERSRTGSTLLSVDRLTTRFPIRGGVLSRVVGEVHAVEQISFEIREGEVVGLVGESGSGKTTAGRSVMRLLEPTNGAVIFNGIDLLRLTRKGLRDHRKDIQIIFQDPFAALDPRMTVGEIVGEGLDIHRLARGSDKKARVINLLESVGLSASDMQRYPHEFSGGQRQRIGIARALAVEPKLIVADEPVSALDVSIQAQVVNLLLDLKEQFGLTILFIAHDLGVVEYICDRVIVMYLGRIMETGSTAQLYNAPVHPYTEALLAAAPVPDPGLRKDRVLLQGDIPSPIMPPSGCVFRTRCPIAVERCADQIPPLEEVEPGHYKACILR